jgi:cytochrome c peroxidase
MGIPVHRFSVNRRQVGLLPSQTGTAPWAIWVRFSTHSSVRPAAPGRLNAHSRSAVAPAWWVQLAPSPPTTTAGAPTRRRVNLGSAGVRGSCSVTGCGGAGKSAAASGGREIQSWLTTSLAPASSIPPSATTIVPGASPSQPAPHVPAPATTPSTTTTRRVTARSSIAISVLSCPAAAVTENRPSELRYGPGMPQFGHPLSLLRLGVLAAVAGLPAACSDDRAATPSTPEPAEVALGQRLFRETRFAQFFAARAAGDMNRRLAEGDPTVAAIATPGGMVPGPYGGQSMNCAGCHLSDELAGGNQRPAFRAFADFNRRSPVPDRGDGHATTTRNAASLVDAVVQGVPGRPALLLLHHDGEHASAEDLVQGSFTGRNFGWLPGERAEALAHVANVIRRDQGGDALAARFGKLPYRVVFAGVAAEIPAPLRLPEAFRIDVEAASDQQVLAAVARVVAAYLGDQRLARDDQGQYRGSPYDRFLSKNQLPAAPAPGETVEEYGRRLYTQVTSLTAPAYVTATEGQLRHQDQPFVFGPDELTGLIKFLGRPGETPSDPPGLWACSTCHPPPHFTDFGFHNTGVSELEYDGIHGAGSFAALAIPTLEQRRSDEAAFLPPSSRLPGGSSVFRAIAAREHPGRTDLGLWNVMLNDDAPAVQPALRDMFCPLVADAHGSCGQEDLLTASIASFKTRGLRGLGHSGPYFHNGQADTLEAAVEHYLVVALSVRNGTLRNGDLALEWLRLSYVDVPPLAAFLRSLNE